MLSIFSHKPLLYLYLFTLLPTLIASTPPQSCNNNNNRPYSSRMANSVIARDQAIAPSHADTKEPKASVYLQVGFFQTAVLRLLEYYSAPAQAQAPTPESACVDTDRENWEEYLRVSTDSLIPWLEDAKEDVDYPLDRFSTGRGLLAQYLKTNNPKAKTALDALNASTTLQPRNQHGGYWYFHYPNWSYLDGMYSLVPFLTYYTTHFDSDNTPAAADAIIHQLDLLWRHCRQDTTGLLVHAYDASSPAGQKASWADADTGASRFVWGRSLGWYFMSLVDTLELVVTASPVVFPGRLERYLHARFVELADAVYAAADHRGTGCWWQVMEFPGREGNYIESSGSAMFAYALYKGVRLGYLSGHGPGDGVDMGDRYTNVAEKCYAHLVDEFVVENGNGTLGYNGTVGVCSMDSEATYEYYVSQPLLYNSLHGTAAFTLASLEHELLNSK